MLGDVFKKMGEFILQFVPMLGPICYLLVILVVSIVGILLLCNLKSFIKPDRVARPYEELAEYLELDLPPRTTLLFKSHEDCLRRLLADSKLVPSSLPFTDTKDGERVTTEFSCVKGTFEVVQGMRNRLWSYIPKTYQLWGRIGRSEVYSILQSQSESDLLNEFAWYEVLKSIDITVKPISISASTPSLTGPYRTMITNGTNSAMADLYAEAWGGELADWTGLCIDACTQATRSIAALHTLGIVHGAVSSLSFSAGSKYLVHNFSKAVPLTPLGVRSDLNDILSMFMKMVSRTPLTSRPTVATVLVWWQANNLLNLPYLKWGEDFSYDPVEAENERIVLATLKATLINNTGPVFRQIMVAAEAGDAHAMIEGFQTLNKVRLGKE